MTDPPVRFIDKESYNQAIQDVLQTIANMPSFQPLNSITIPETILRDHNNEPTGVVVPERMVPMRRASTLSDIVEKIKGLKHQDISSEESRKGITTHEMRLKLDRRIHNQRVALRENWMIVDQRIYGARQWLRSIYKSVSALCDTFEIPKGEGVGTYSIHGRMRRLEQKFKDLENKGDAT